MTRPAEAGRAEAGQAVWLGAWIVLALAAAAGAQVPVRVSTAHRPVVGGPLLIYEPVDEVARRVQIQRDRQQGSQAARTLGVRLTALESDYFLIFTDWPADQHAWLKATCDQMYRRLARQFDLPRGRIIWAGKCPIYCFDQTRTFLQFAQHLDGMRHPIALSGYAQTRSDGRVHLALHRQRNRNRFAKVLVHEGSHAFLHRYISNRHIDPWLNEGLAELMAALLAEGNTIRADAIKVGRAYVRSNIAIGSVFAAESWCKPQTNHYRVAYLLVESLIAKDSKALAGLIRDMKRGHSAQTALTGNYRMNFTQFEAYWRRYVGSLDH